MASGSGKPGKSAGTRVPPPPVVSFTVSLEEWAIGAKIQASGQSPMEVIFPSGMSVLQEPQGLEEVPWAGRQKPGFHPQPLLELTVSLQAHTFLSLSFLIYTMELRTTLSYLPCRSLMKIKSDRAC